MKIKMVGRVGEVITIRGALVSHRDFRKERKGRIETCQYFGHQNSLGSSDTIIEFKFIGFTDFTEKRYLIN